MANWDTELLDVNNIYGNEKNIEFCENWTFNSANDKLKNRSIYITLFKHF